MRSCVALVLALDMAACAGRVGLKSAPQIGRVSADTLHAVRRVHVSDPLP